MNILNPPKNYIDYRCATHGKKDEEYERIRTKFFKEFNCEEEVTTFCNILYVQRNTLELPYEHVELIEQDGKKHGIVRKMMIFDIQYWREGGQIKKRKIYMANQGELARDEEHYVDNKSRASGERDPREEG